MNANVLRMIFWGPDTVRVFLRSYKNFHFYFSLQTMWGIQTLVSPEIFVVVGSRGFVSRDLKFDNQSISCSLYLKLFEWRTVVLEIAVGLHAVRESSIAD